MSVVVQLPTVGQSRERRLHLRDLNQPAAPDAGTLRVGQVLRARREALGLDERTVATRLCLRRDLVVAIESGQYSRLHGRVYALGYIRSYALLLGLDAGPIVGQFKSEVEAQDTAPAGPAAFPDVVPSVWGGSYRVLGAAGLGAGLLYLMVQVVFAPAPTPTAADAAGNSDVVVVDPVPEPAVKVVRAATPASSAVAALTVAAPPAAGPIEAANPPPVSSSPIPVVADAVAPPAARIVLMATEAAYLEIRDTSVLPRGARLVARELAAGESFSVPDRKGLVLVTGNAGGVQVAVDGRATGALGERGQVIRGLQLDPAYFLSRPATSR